MIDKFQNDTLKTHWYLQTQTIFNFKFSNKIVKKSIFSCRIIFEYMNLISLILEFYKNWISMSKFLFFYFIIYCLNYLVTFSVKTRTNWNLFYCVVICSCLADAGIHYLLMHWRKYSQYIIDTPRKYDLVLDNNNPKKE